MPSYDCPNCASPAVQAYSQLYGEQYAYPQRRGMGCGGWLCILMAIGGINAFVMLAFSPSAAAVKFFAIVPAAFALGFAYLAYRQTRVAKYYNEELYPITVAQWKRSYHCHRCGHNFFFR